MPGRPLIKHQHESNQEKLLKRKRLREILSHYAMHKVKFSLLVER